MLSSGNNPANFSYLIEQFADIKIMRYQVPGFEKLKLKQKKLIYYLSQAALSGRDIIFDQFYRYNLLVRRTNEAIVESYSGCRDSEIYRNFLVYTKRVWFSNGIHHHYSTEKFFPELTRDEFNNLIINSDTNLFPLLKGETIATFANRVLSLIYDDQSDLKRVCLDSQKDIISESANNFYEGLTLKEVEAYNMGFVQPDPGKPISQGLNSRLVKKNGQVTEEIYRVGGLYGAAIEKIVFWLQHAKEFAENKQQKSVIEKLIDYYQTGDLKTWDEFNTLWVDDLESHIDFVNGFIEVYGDPLGMKATWESLVNFKDTEATHRAVIISKNAQWFEDNAPVDSRFKKEIVKGVTAKVITAVQLGGDCYPSTPIGINLPNADWIRKEHGSKSVTIENITFAYHQASLGNGFLEEFCYNHDERKLAEEFGYQASNLHTDLHECLGHGSGQLLPGVSGDALKNYSSVLEEARADLFALYYIADNKMVELGLLPNNEAFKAEYNTFMRNGLLTQLTRIQPGKEIEEAHMRNRQLIARWCLNQGKSENVVELKRENGKTYMVINNYQKLRQLFGNLLAEIQRIKSEGDFASGQALVEKYAVKIDQDLHTEILERYKKLGLAPYGGFVNPVLKPVYQANKMVDIEIDYSEGYEEQMMRYSREFSFL
jgi:dipeptidyl-peptidase III